MNNCSEKNCPRYVVLNDRQKIKETNYSKGFYECDSCLNIYCCEHSEIHVGTCEGAMGARSILK